MTPLESMRVVAGHFNALGVPYAFLGAAVLPLLVDDPELSEIRPTKDVDLTVKVMTLGELYQLEEKLRAAGFRNDTREGAPICRWVVSGVTVDVMPTEGSVLGMSAEWFREALETASQKFLGEGVRAPVIGAPCFLATKLAAFRDRGLSDLYLSKDLEDILTLLDGCESIVALVREAPSPVGSFLVRELAIHLRNPEFVDALPGFFRTDEVSLARMLLVKERLAQLADLPG
ncbi:MAG: hypothetical protein ACOYM3_30840 [Terrimicrobiaceae bacterium]